MKFTKLMALALVLVMLVSAFVACGGPEETETDPPATETDAPDTNPPQKETETDPPATETDPPCEHPENRRREMDRVDPSCTEDGYVDYLCRLCDEQWRETLPKTHTYGELKSTDGKYTRYTCVYCGDAYVVDENGATVADASAIAFPFFNADFTGVATLADAVAGFSDVKLVAEDFVGFVTNAAEGNTYINVPTGTSAIAPNGYFELSDVNNKLATKDFSVKFAVQFSEFPKEAIALLTWKIGGSEYDLLTIDATGKISVLGSEQSKVLTDKGWDVIEVCFDNETADYYVYMNDQIFAKGNLGVAVAGKTESAVRFFEGASQFEAYMDNIDIKFIDEAKTDACIHVYAETAKTAATCEADGKVTYKCSVCNNTYEEVLPAFGHDLGEATVVDSTCTTEGSNSAVCKTCGNTVVSVIPVKGHTVGWEIVDGTPLQTCSVCDYAVSYKTSGEAILALDFDKTIEEAVGEKFKVNPNTATIVDQEGNKVLDVKTTRIDDSANHAIFGVDYMLFTARIKVSQHAHTSEKKESLISFINGYAGTEKVGQATPWGICLASISSPDGTTKLALSKAPLDGQFIVATFEEWYDLTIIGCGESNKYYVFIGETLLGAVSRPDYADENFGGGATLRFGENGDSQAFLDDITIFEIVPN